MAGFKNQTEDDILDLLFTNVDAPNWGDAAGLQNSATPGDLYLSLHLTDALTDADTQQTSQETTYTGYSRQAVPRSTAGWTVSNPNVTNDTLEQFGSMTAGGPVTITDVGIGFASTGAGYLHVYGQVSDDLVVNNGVNPQFAISALSISLD